MSELPSPWSVSVGAAVSDGLVLDAMNVIRQQRVAWWSTHGALRVAAVLMVVLLGAAAVRQHLALGYVRAQLSDMEGAAGQDGLVSAATSKAAVLSGHVNSLAEQGSRLRFLDGERRAGRAALELLGAITSLQGPRMLVKLDSYKVQRPLNQSDRLVVSLRGRAMSSNNLRPSEVLSAFEKSLRQRYPAISQMETEKVPQSGDQGGIAFGYRVVIPDQFASPAAKQP